MVSELQHVKVVANSYQPGFVPETPPILKNSSLLGVPGTNPSRYKFVPTFASCNFEIL